MISLLNAVDSSIKTFLNQLYESLGIGGFLGIILAVEALFIILYVVKSIFSYEARLKRTLDSLNKWLFTNKVINENNITEFNALVKKGPKRLVYYWQQYILYRDGGPAQFLSEENIITKPLKTSSWKSNVKSLLVLSGVWSFFSLILGFATQPTQTFTASVVAYAFMFPLFVMIMAAAAVLIIKGRRSVNLDDIYHSYHLFARFLTNACVELTPYIDFDLLFTAEEIEKGNPQLREYYEQRAIKAKEEFDKARKTDDKPSDYNFEEVGVDGALLLDRAMKESDTYISKKTACLSQIAQVEAQKDALRRNYETAQMDLQRKIQASKENIQKLIEQQAATTSRIEVGLLKQQQDKEVTKQAGLQKDLDNETARYNASKEELEKEVEKLQAELNVSLDEATKGMVNEYRSFFEKVMKSAYKVAEKKVIDEKNTLIAEKNKNEEELINVQTQIKRLIDENNTLRVKLEEYDNKFKENLQTEEGHYDEQGNYVYADGSYHDEKGLFHDVDGKVYDSSGALVSKDEKQLEKESDELLRKEQIESFGGVIEEPTETEQQLVEEAVEPAPEVATEEVKEEKPAKSKGSKKSKKKKDEEKDLAEINSLINEQESEIQSLKDSIDNQIDEVLSDANEDKDKLLKEIELLQAEAEKAQENGDTAEVEEINKKLDAMIQELSKLNG